MTDQIMNVLISRREEQADGIVVLDLVAPDGAPLPTFQPGAHLDVHVGPGLVRQYSLCGSPSDTRRYRLGILLDPASRGGSAAIHREFREGQQITVSLPRNNFPLSESASHSVLIGGGIGVTPILAMAHHLDRAGTPFDVHYCARERAKAAFLKELAEAPYHERVRLHFDDEGEAQRFVPSRDLPKPAPGTHLYICGPTGFMDWVIAEAGKAGHAATNIHREYFNVEADTAGDAFEVVLSASGKTVQVPSDSTIVKALAGIGVKIEVSCEQGVCGTCLCTVLEGTPDHRDVYLTDDEKEANDQILVCCSRSKTPRLVLDL